MKKIAALFLVFLIRYTTGFAQTIDGKALKDLDVEYLEIVGEAKPLTNKHIIGIDYGQPKQNYLYPLRNTKIKDANGNIVQFSYMVEALNFMVKNGFEFVQAYTAIEDNTNYYHYILKKKAQSEPLPTSLK